MTEREFGDCSRPRPGDAGERDAVCLSMFDVDVVEARTGADEQFEPGAARMTSAVIWTPLRKTIT